ncbi:MAG: hypothetical protein QOI80_65, partial [Solirubrobacteraceae bacterium]|nr:hypothetical protein [Solirubrobacteraceae bacterium]
GGPPHLDDARELMRSGAPYSD